MATTLQRNNFFYFTLCSQQQFCKEIIGTPYIIGFYIATKLVSKLINTATIGEISQNHQHTEMFAHFNNVAYAHILPGPSGLNTCSETRYCVYVSKLWIS